MSFERNYSNSSADISSDEADNADDNRGRSVKKSKAKEMPIFLKFILCRMFVMSKTIGPNIIFFFVTFVTNN